MPGWDTCPIGPPNLGAHGRLWAEET